MFSSPVYLSESYVFLSRLRDETSKPRPVHNTAAQLISSSANVIYRAELGKTNTYALYIGFLRL